MTVNKFRASNTILSAWASGDWNKAIKYYFHLETFTSPAMLAGRQFHEEWQREINRTKCLPVVFGGKKLNDPICEGKKVVSIEEWLDLVGIIDCRDGSDLYEFKTGKTTSESYANDNQIGVYGVLCLYDKIKIDKVEIHHYDQYQKKSDMSIIWMTDKLLQDSLNWIITLSGEMHDYLLKNKLYEKYGKKY